MFTDRVYLELRAGKGGNGVVAWRREKYIPKGGPYGGDGGKGGSVVFVSETHLSSLESFRNKSIIKAENGQQGGTNRRRGRNGRDLVLQVPCGTLIKDRVSGEIVYDFTKPGERFVFCKGGIGGKGNAQFATPTNRAPNIATDGRLGELARVELELKLIADVGLVGFPNAGKSTFISQVTQIPVKIAPYPFTTLRPNLGMLISDNQERLLIADIPGIIAGAHKNKGLGLEFLRHIERTSVLLFVVDISGIDGRDPLEDFQVLQEELKKHNPKLLEKPCCVAINKIDVGKPEVIEAFKKECTMPLFEISAIGGQGVESLITFLKRKLSK